jgi:hypothetical protein
MNRPAQGGKAKKELSTVLDSHLKLYVLSAGAVGVSLMALAQPAAAEIVYTQVHHILPLSPYAEYFDINGDGVPDLAFWHFTNQPTSNDFYNTIQVDVGKNEVMDIGVYYAKPLADGAIIGASQHFRNRLNFMAQSSYVGYCCHRYLHGPWNNVENHYLGVSFKIGAETHYGWIRMSVSDPHWPLTVLITGYAYETVPNQSLRAGQTSDNADVAVPQAKTTQPAVPKSASLGMLAAGFYGLQVWRREEQ